MRRFVVKVTGQVQGVFYRHTARLHAEKLGITGFARNEADDSVAIVAEGEEEALNQFLEWCRRGPPLARVDEIKTEWREATGEHKGFEIL
ncbi:MAG: acylphosphatase [Patescibacteria group bacterium]